MKRFLPLSFFLVIFAWPLWSVAKEVEVTEVVSETLDVDEVLQEHDQKADGKKKENEKDEDKPPEPSVTQHRAVIGGQEISYTATATQMLLEEDGVKDKANVFFVAYTKDGVEDVSQRPITFCFNGGPGSSSVWLHLGAFGPKRVRLPDDASRVRPPRQVEENPFSMLDKTDLVFIDPVSTGFSRPVEGENKKQFHGYDEDLRSVGQFIHDYVTQYGRWSSPKFLIGESYGGLRAAGLSGTLQQRYNMYLNGIVLVSAVVDFQTLSFRSENDVAFASFLPTYAATAWYHNALDEDLQSKPVRKVAQEARAFARNVYHPALIRGDGLQPARRAAIIGQMARLTGLSEEYLSHSKLRVPGFSFQKELLRDQRLVVGRFDSRYTGFDRNSAGARAEHDPSGTAVFGPFTSAMNDYLRSELKYQDDRVYEILTGKVHPWSYDRFKNRYVNASETLRQAMTNNPYLKVFAACGYYDLATPFYAMEYTRDHLELPPELQGNFAMGYYEGGHMMYIHEPSLKKLRKDLLKFYDSALGTED